MNTEEFCEILGDISDSYVQEARAEHKVRKAGRFRLAAACLCLVAAGVAVSRLPGLFLDQGSGGAPNGVFPDGVDPIIASLAVYPATERVQDVADASMEPISEADAYGFEPLGEYLPAALPEGYHFGSAYLYKTTMENGTNYHLLRVTYTNGEPAAREQTGGDGETAADPNTFGEHFDLFVMDYRPETEQQIYKPEDITAGVLDQTGGRTFHISYGDIYVGVTPSSASADDILTALNAIR